MLSDIVVSARQNLPEINIDTATLLLKKLIDRLISFRKEVIDKKECSDVSPLAQIMKDIEKLNLPEIEMHGLCYIGGYVYKKLYKKIKNSSNWKSKNNQMVLSFGSRTRPGYT